MSAPPGFAELEADFGAYLRDPDRVAPPPGVDPARAAIYARLVFNNLDALLAKSFPVLRSVLDDAAWRALLRDYLVRHRADMPLFPRLPEDFANFVTSERADCDDPAWLGELADYEWLELECAQDSREIDSLAPVDPAADLLDDVPVLNPLARLRRYHHAVHAIAPSRLPPAAPAEGVWLAVFRDRRDKVCFLQLNAVTARLVELMACNERETGRALLLRIAGELSHPRPAKLVDAGRQILVELLTRGLLVGARMPR